MDIIHKAACISVYILLQLNFPSPPHLAQAMLSILQFLLYVLRWVCHGLCSSAPSAIYVFTLHLWCTQDKMVDICQERSNDDALSVGF